MIAPSSVTVGMMKVLEAIRADETALPKWHQIVDLLSDSKLLNFLQELGKVKKLPFDTPNYVDAQASEAARASGVNEVIDWLLNFRDVLSSEQAAVKVQPGYLGLETALTNGDITEAEYDAIKSGRPIPDYQFEQPRFKRPAPKPGDPVKPGA